MWWQRISQHPLTASAFLPVQSLEALCVSHPQRAALQWHHSISYRRTIEKKWLNAVRGTGKAVPVRPANACMMIIKWFFLSWCWDCWASTKSKDTKRHTNSHDTNLYECSNVKCPRRLPLSDVTLSETGNSYTTEGDVASLLAAFISVCVCVCVYVRAEGGGGDVRRTRNVHKLLHSSIWNSKISLNQEAAPVVQPQSLQVVSMHLR